MADDTGAAQREGCTTPSNQEPDLYPAPMHVSRVTDAKGTLPESLTAYLSYTS